jgi:hypothetical protein
MGDASSALSRPSPLRGGSAGESDPVLGHLDLYG